MSDFEEFEKQLSENRQGECNALRSGSACRLACYVAPRVILCYSCTS